MAFGPAGTVPYWMRKFEFSRVDVVGESGHATLAKSGPTLPAEFPLRMGIEDRTEARAEFAGAQRPACVQIIQHCGLAIDQHQLVVFLVVEIAELDGKRIEQAPAAVALRVLRPAHHFGADEVGQRVRVPHGRFARLFEQSGLFGSSSCAIAGAPAASRAKSARWAGCGMGLVLTLRAPPRRSPCSHRKISAKFLLKRAARSSAARS